MQEYLMTPAALEENCLYLGLMTEKGYGEFMSQARTQAAEQDIANPILGLAMTFKPASHPMGLTEYAYPISEAEWDQFVREIDQYCSETPKVYLVDGDKYALPI